MMPTPKPTRLIANREWQNKAINIAAKIVLLGAKCATCGRTGSHSMALHAHHIIKRKYGNTCALPENLIPLCASCHSRAHSNEAEFRTWLAKRSPGLYDRLWQLARAICTLDFEDVYAEMLEQYHAKLVEKAENNGIKTQN